MLPARLVELGISPADDHVANAERSQQVALQERLNGLVLVHDLAEHVDAALPVLRLHLERTVGQHRAGAEPVRQSVGEAALCARTALLIPAGEIEDPFLSIRADRNGIPCK